jgi:hypothetical protein
MADKKLTLLPALTDPVGTDVMMIVDDVTGTPVSKKIEVEDLFGAQTQLSVAKVNIASTDSLELSSTTTTNITATGGATVTGTLSVTDALTVVANGANIAGNTIVTGTLTSTDTFTAPKARLTSSQTMSNNNAESFDVGTIIWDENYIYVVTDTGVIKRAALATF